METSLPVSRQNFETWGSELEAEKSQINSLSFQSNWIHCITVLWSPLEMEKVYVGAAPDSIHVWFRLKVILFNFRKQEVSATSAQMVLMEAPASQKSNLPHPSIAPLDCPEKLSVLLERSSKRQWIFGCGLLDAHIDDLILHPHRPIEPKKEEKRKKCCSCSRTRIQENSPDSVEVILTPHVTQPLPMCHQTDQIKVKRCINYSTSLAASPL